MDWKFWSKRQNNGSAPQNTSEFARRKTVVGLEINPGVFVDEDIKAEKGRSLKRVKVFLLVKQGEGDVVGNFEFGFDAVRGSNEIGSINFVRVHPNNMKKASFIKLEKNKYRFFLPDALTIISSNHGTLNVLSNNSDILFKYEDTSTNGTTLLRQNPFKITFLNKKSAVLQRGNELGFGLTDTKKGKMYLYRITVGYIAEYI